MAGDEGKESKGEKEERQGVGEKGEVQEKVRGRLEYRLSDIPKNGSKSP